MSLFYSWYIQYSLRLEIGVARNEREESNIYCKHLLRSMHSFRELKKINKEKNRLRLEGRVEAFNPNSFVWRLIDMDVLRELLSLLVLFVGR